MDSACLSSLLNLNLVLRVHSPGCSSVKLPLAMELDKPFFVLSLVRFIGIFLLSSLFCHHLTGFLILGSKERVSLLRLARLHDSVYVAVGQILSKIILSYPPELFTA